MANHVKNYFVPHSGNQYKPHLLRERSVAVLFCLGFILFCTSLGSSYILNKTDFGAAVLPAVLVDLTNDHRIANSQRPLTVNPTLQAAALLKAKDMATNGYFAHTSPSGVTPWQWFTKAGYRFVYAGENLAINFTESSDVEAAWIASPTHHANLISDKFDETGIATYDGIYEGRPTTFVVQLFGKRPGTRVAPPAASVTPIVVPAAQEQVAVVPSAPVILPEVKGVDIKSETPPKQAALDPTEPAPVLLVNEPTFAVVQNINESDAPDTAPSLTAPRYSTLAQRLLVNQARTVQYIYLICMIIIYIVLLSMIVVEFRVQHIKNVALAILLLAFLGVLSYINSSFVLSFL